tara:strand:+ start:120 stop:473 length:354 start_codon:yes stop_codon:yes gene_type:complete
MNAHLLLFEHQRRGRLNPPRSWIDTKTESQLSARRAKPQSCLTSIKPSKFKEIDPFLTTNLLILTNYLFRYLVPKDLAAFNFNHIIRKRIKLPETSSLYFFVNGRYLLKGGKYLYKN